MTPESKSPLPAPDREREAAAALRAIKWVHTLVWAFFATAIIAIPVCTGLGRTGWATALIAVVLVEVLILAFNGWRCPLTDRAARHTDDRRDNFDIYLPAWLARHNKLVFGLLYLAGIVYTVARWAL